MGRAIVCSETWKMVLVTLTLLSVAMPMEALEQEGIRIPPPTMLPKLPQLAPITLPQTQILPPPGVRFRPAALPVQPSAPARAAVVTPSEPGNRGAAMLRATAVQTEEKDTQTLTLVSIGNIDQIPVAIIRTSAQSAPVVIGIGDTVLGWRLRAIGASQAVMQQGASYQILQLGN